MPSTYLGLGLICCLSLLPTAQLIKYKDKLFFPFALNGILLIPVFMWISVQFPAESSFINTCLFFAFLLGPLVAQKLISQSGSKSEFNEPIFLTLILKTLCPFFPIAEIRKCFKAFKNSDPIDQIKDNSHLAIALKAQLFFHRGEWLSAHNWLNNFTQYRITRSAWMTLLRIRTYCQNGQISDAIVLTQKVRDKETQLSFYPFHLIYIFSFSGNIAGTKMALKVKETEINESNAKVWLANSLFHSPDSLEEGRAELIELVTSDNLRISKSAQEALNVPPCQKPELTNHFIDDLKRNEALYKIRKNRKILTVTLALVNLGLFFYSSSNTQFADQFTLRTPEIYETKEYWRLLTTTFMHFDLAHCLSNVIMLLLFGVFTESHFNKIKYLTIYILSGLFGMAIITFMHRTNTHATIILGASGSTMALLGSQLAIILKKRQRLALKVFNYQIFLLIGICFFQFTSDLLTPRVSFTAHFSGLVFGLALAYLLYKGQEQPVELKDEQQS
ncbi:MAG: rhomboid family intramembrane serine protease [Lentisphaeraceae bacterium]|nr:rhomboid family intramembrane serine protease [Lentisphaeraceae bacterium]